MKVEVENANEIQRVWIYYQTDRLCIVRIDTTTKRPEPMGIAANQLIFKDGERIKFSDLPWEPMIMLWTTGRYYLDVVIQDEEIETEFFNSKTLPLFVSKEN